MRQCLVLAQVDDLDTGVVCILELLHRGHILGRTSHDWQDHLGRNSASDDKTTNGHGASTCHRPQPTTRQTLTKGTSLLWVDTDRNGIGGNLLPLDSRFRRHGCGSIPTLLVLPMASGTLDHELTIARLSPKCAGNTGCNRMSKFPYGKVRMFTQECGRILAPLHFLASFATDARWQKERHDD